MDELEAALQAAAYVVVFVLIVWGLSIILGYIPIPGG